MNKIRGLLGLAIIVGGIYAGWNLIPPYFANYKLEDVVAEEARTSTYTAKSEDQIRDDVFQKASDLDIALTREQIAVQKTGSTVAIEVNYSVHVDFPFHPVDLAFHTSSKNRGY